MSTKKPNIIAIDGGKKNTKTDANEDTPYLMVEGERIDLECFVLAGKNVDDSRVILTYNSSIDELVTFTKVLDIVVTEKVKEALGE